MPWETLAKAIQGGAVPAQGKLWALGCESLKLSELEALKDEVRQLRAMLEKTVGRNI